MEKTPPRHVRSFPGNSQPFPQEDPMKISTAQVWVHDQDEALAFYTEKLGMEVRSDVTLAG